MSDLASDDFLAQERKWRRQDQEREDRIAREKRNARVRHSQYWATAFAMVGVTGAVVFGLWSWATTDAENSLRRDEVCYAAGGTRLALAPGAEPQCVRITIDGADLPPQVSP